MANTIRMVHRRCWGCLLRSRCVELPTRSIAFVPVHSFSTSPSSAAQPQAPKNQRDVSLARGGKTLRIKKKAFVQTGRPVAPGERKAYRKRVVLSNVNALDVQGMKELSSDSLMGSEARGTMLALPGTVVDQLRALEAFKARQGWKLFRKPGVLVRDESVRIGRVLEEAENETGRRTHRMIISGAKGVGKSTMLLQAMATALVKGWIVISIPNAQDLTIAHTEYAPLPKSTPLQYVQKTYTANLLGQVAKANQALLSTLQLSQKHTLPVPLQANLSLARLAEMGARDPDIAWPVFVALWRELMAPSTATNPRPPVLYALDGLAHIMRDSHYRAVDFSPIHAHDLTMVQHFVSALSGATDLPNGGAVMAATSASNRPGAPTFELGMRQLEARAAGVPEPQIPRPSPFERQDERVAAALRDVDVMTLQGLSRDEARGLMEYYAASGMLRERVDEERVVERWTLAGGGVVGELERGVRGMRL